MCYFFFNTDLINIKDVYIYSPQDKIIVAFIKITLFKSLHPLDS